jgi:ATP-dependent helicase/nuclease subunit A
MSDQLSLFDSVSTPPDSDADARRFAQDPRHNVVLEASAGTGKTTVLVTRYVNLLMRGVDPANILAITFTRKAAAEMRERILRDLRRAAELNTFDRGRWVALRDQLADIQISTIDAFCLSLLREFPLEADLDPGFAMADETEVPRLIDQALDKSLAIFVGLAKREPDLALVLAQLGIARTREGLASLLDRRLVAWDVLDRFLARGPSDLTAGAICRRAVDGLIDLFHSLPGGLERFLADGPVEHPRYQMLARDLRRLEAFRGTDDAAVRGLIDRMSAHFLKGDGKRRSTDRIHPYTNDHYPSPDRGKRHRVAALQLSEPIENLARAFSRDLNAVLARGIRRMFSIALAQYRIALNERSVLDFSDVLERAVDLLGRMDEFSQSRYRLEGRYHHVLVDEFQDTSRKQWELVSLLVKAWGEGLGLASNPSIFIVGDRKQSIYRFRDAEVAVLQEAGRFIEGLSPGSSGRRSITRSFRAVPELLAFVNELFGEMGRGAQRADDFKYDDGDRFPIETASDRHGPVLGMAVADDPLVCASAVADEIARVLREESVRDKQTGISREVRPGDIAILFRSRASHREFEDALEARGIPTYVYKGLGFFDADEIKDMSALIRYLANPSSDLRAAAFLRSRFVRLSDVSLGVLAPRLAQAIVDPEPPPGLAALLDDDRLALEHARAHVPGWIQQVDRVPPADLLESILPEVAYAYELRGPRRQQAWENLKKMRALVRRIQNRGYATLARIADHLDALTAGDESNAVLEALDAVNLMTVHASKGLEYPVVFVVNLAKGASGPPKPVRVSGEDVSVGPFVSATDEEEKAREREETKRLLYVALTRARDRLYLGSVLKEGRLAPGRGSLAEVLPESVKAVFARAASPPQSLDSLEWTAESGRSFTFRTCVPRQSEKTVKVPTSGLHVNDNFGALTDDRETMRASVTSSLEVGDVAGEPSAAGNPEDAFVGTLVHRLIRSGGRLSVDRPIDELVTFADSLVTSEERVSLGDAAAAVGSAVDAWIAIMRQPEVVQLLESGERLYEVPFSMLVAGTPPRILRGSVDCLIRHPDGSMTVVEFKTGRPTPGHQEQLNVYVRAVQGLFPQAGVIGRLIYPVGSSDHRLEGQPLLRGPLLR